MNTETGAIAKFETDEDAKAAGYDLPLTEEQYRELAPMNRHERRAWAAQQRRAGADPEQLEAELEAMKAKAESVMSNENESNDTDLGVTPKEAKLDLQSLDWPDVRLALFIIIEAQKKAPKTRERSLVITKLEEARLWAGEAMMVE